MKVVVWSKYNCTYCDQAKSLLSSNNIEFEERKLGDGWSKEDLFKVAPHVRSVPQVFINETLIGGFTQLQQYLKENNVN